MKLRIISFKELYTITNISLLNTVTYPYAKLDEICY